MLTRSDFMAVGALLGTSALAAPQRASRSRRIRFGANYVPTKNWWYCWGDWDRDSIRRDLHDIAALGLDHIRVQLLWPQFQPNAATVSAEHLHRLAQLLDEAERAALDVEVTVLDGQLSGFLFVPAYLIDNQNGRIRNFVTDAHLDAPQRLLFRELSGAVGAHPRFLGFDIANEIYWFTQPLHVGFTPQQGDAWMERLLGYCRRYAPGKFHVNGVDKWPYESSEPHGFTRPALARAGCASCIHPWAGFSPVFKTYGPLSLEATHYAEFFLQYMQAFSANGARTLWIEEDGCSKQWMNEDLIPHWAEASIRNAASVDHLFGITWWCSHDVNSRYSGFNELEYDLGLYTNDRRLKPLGRMLRELVAEFDRTPPAVLRRPDAIAIAPSTGGDELLEPYVRLVESGVRAQIVLADRTHDAAYLRSRGIERLVGN